MKNLYSYSNYRQYLKDYYLTMKAEDPWFSYQKFSQAAEVKSPNYLKLIIDGKRDLTVSNIHQFARALRLSETEADFFESLVLWNQASAPLEKSFYKRRLQQMKAGRIENQKRVKIKNLGQYPYLPAIVVACLGLPVETGAHSLAERFHIGQDQVRKILGFLQAEGILHFTEGTYQLTENYFVQFDHMRSNVDQKQFLREQLELSKKFLETRYSIDAQFFAHTFSASAERLPEITKRLATLLEELTNETNDDPPEQVLQLNIQLFPLDPR